MREDVAGPRRVGFSAILQLLSRELGAFQQSRLEIKEPNASVIEIHSVTIHQDFLL
jgi:hypothetical protein